MSSVVDHLSSSALAILAGRRREDDEEDGVRDRRERVCRLGAHQDVAGEGLRREDDGQEPRYLIRSLLASSINQYIQIRFPKVIK